MTGARRPRLLFHVQHMLGIGHRIRADRIALACARAGFDVTVLEGGVPDGIHPEQPGVTRVHLPPARAADAGFSAIVDAETGREIDDAWRVRRAAACLDEVLAAKPDVFLVESYPFARRAFAFELDPAIAEARRGGAKVAASIRDILVARPDRQKNARIAEKARSLFDRILVHGDPGFAQLADSFSAAPVVADRVTYTGIVGPDPVQAITDPSDGEIVVSVGGGAVGGALIRAAIEARALCRLKDRPWRILVGPNLPDSDRPNAVPPGIVIEPARPDFLSLLSNACLSVSQAGYNTVADLAVSGCPSVLVPFAGPSGKETEQPLRAQLMQAAGRAVCLPESDLTPQALADAVDRAATLFRHAETPYRTGGAAASARALMELVG